MRTATERQSSSARRHRPWRLALGVGLCSWVILACTAPRMPIVWDEGDYLFRADQIVAWFLLLIDVGNPRGGLNALSGVAIQHYWPFVTWGEGHPAWFAVPIAAGKGLVSGPLSPLTAARLGPITVFSIACGAVALRLKRLRYDCRVGRSDRPAHAAESVLGRPFRHAGWAADGVVVAPLDG